MAQPDAPAAKLKKASRAKPKVPPEIKIKVSWCKGCGLCVDYCNREVLEMKGTLPEVVNTERCNRCLMCEAICPDFAITVVEKSASKAKGPKGGGR